MAIKIFRHVREVVRLAVDRNLEQRAGAKRVSKAPRPPIGVEQRRNKVVDIPFVAAIRNEVIERLYETGGDVLPEQHRPGHEDVCSTVSGEFAMDRVREVGVAVDKPYVNRDASASGEFTHVALDGRYVRISVRGEEDNLVHL